MFQHEAGPLRGRTERSGIHTVVLPQQNLADLREIPEELARRIHFIGVAHMDEVLEAALERMPPARRNAPVRRASPSAARGGVATARPPSRR